MQPQSFDSYAADYDEHFTHSSIGQLQRKSVWRFIQPALQNVTSVLEINCGTGHDALYLANKGFKVTATDASAGMIGVAKRKAEGYSNLSFIQASFSDLTNLLKGNTYDFVLSNFGGLNCIGENDIRKLSKDLHQLLNVNGKAGLVVMGRKCIWEQLYFTIKGDTKKAFRRKNKQSVDSSLTPTWFYSPDEMARIFRTNFAIQYVRPIGLLVPPSYLQAWFNNKKWLLNLLAAIEKPLLHLPFFANYADHYLIVLSKK